MTVMDQVLAIYGERGAHAYFGEPVSVIEHGLQAAYFAAAEAAPPALIIAALLHDIGHLVDAVPDDIAEWKTDAGHERVGALWLAQRFPAAVSEPVRLHVPAKRYLCATDEHYFGRLSPASMTTLKLQGGPMSADEAAHFLREPYHRDAVRVRRWDDRGKIAGLVTPALADYRAVIEALEAGGCG